MRKFQRSLREKFADLFDSCNDVVITRAPGRLDVMGGIADYSGSLVLEMPLACSTHVALQLRSDRKLVLCSPEMEGDGRAGKVVLELPDLEVWDSYEMVRDHWVTSANDKWVLYAAGCLATLAVEGHINRVTEGLNIAISSTVPLGAGVSSSAALEVAVMFGLNALYRLGLSSMTLARLAQITENRVVGAPCGIMDQVTSALGVEGELLALRCQPHILEGTVALPTGVHVVGVNSNVRHSVGGSSYTDTRIGTFMGHAIIAHHFREGGHKTDPTDGYLARLSPSEFNSYRSILPLNITGKAFLNSYGSTVDSVTSIDPEKMYKVRSRAEHAVYENSRVERFRGFIGGKTVTEANLISAGRLMYASHWSYGKRAGLGSAETDLLVSLVKSCGVERGLYGAKITGGGSGGTVAILCRERSDEVLEEICQMYKAQTGRTAQMLSGSSPGAYLSGHLVVRV